MKKFILFVFLILTIFTANSQHADKFYPSGVKKYCYTTSAGKYEISLEEGSDNKAYYKLYSGSGQLTKTMQGYWDIRDEGVYRSLFVLTNGKTIDLRQNYYLYD